MLELWNTELIISINHEHSIQTSQLSCKILGIFLFLPSQFLEVCWSKNSSWMLAIKRLIGSYWLVAVYIKADIRVTQSYPKNDKYLVNSLAQPGQPLQVGSVNRALKNSLFLQIVWNWYCLIRPVVLATALILIVLMALNWWPRQ